jgi:primosomal protein N' (replication factor Y)
MKSDIPSLKPIHKLIDTSPSIAPAMLRLTRWIADHYFCSWGQALHAALPTGVRKGTGIRTASVVIPAASPHELKRQADMIEKRAPRQARVLRLLVEQPEPLTRTELARLANSSPSVIDGLRKKHLVRFVSQPMDSVWLEDVQPTSPPKLTREQQAALEPILERIDRDGFEVFLIQGVTGSGKTEIYLQAIDKVVSRGAQAIVLVPEISLTPQTVRRFRERFPRVAVLHSSLTEGHRREQWMAISSHRADVTIGARSAVFAPTAHLGLIVIDEEHENTFKQEETPRYHARDVAITRAHLENVPLILGTATPSLESHYSAVTGE